MMGMKKVGISEYSAGTEPSVPSDIGSARPGREAWRVLPLEGIFQFSYHDAAGTPSLRQLVAHELKIGPGKVLLGGTDLTTGAYRGFRADRIHLLEDVDTGRTIGRNILDWLLKTALAQETARSRRGGTAPTKNGRRSMLDGPTARH
jgi:hypothetical protein